MAVINRIAGFADEMAEWRRALHQRPELGLECHDTARFVVDRLREFGITEIETGVATSGVVAVIEGREPGPRVTGLRADMDALPIEEATGADHASQVPGVMHACGHDGHTAMLLGAAKYLAETRNFAGKAVLIFQPAEEGPGGGNVMVEEGVMETYGVEEVYALHTLPGEALGSFHTAPGPIMAAVDTFHIDITGQGGHAAYPYQTRDPVIAAAGLVQALQTIVSRNTHALDALVVSVTQIHTGSAENIVPEEAYVGGTIRTFDKAVQQMVWQRMKEIVAGQAASFGVRADLRIDEGYPATVNTPAQMAFASDIARDVAHQGQVVTDRQKEMGAEDFAFMLNARPGAYLFLGQGEGPNLHNAGFDFNDEVAPVGASFFARLVERRQSI